MNTETNFTLTELTTLIGDQIKTIARNDLSAERRDIETTKAETLARLAKQYTNATDVMLRTEKSLASGQISKDSSIARIL